MFKILSFYWLVVVFGKSDLCDETDPESRKRSNGWRLRRWRRASATNPGVRMLMQSVRMSLRFN